MVVAVRGDTAQRQFGPDRARERLVRGDKSVEYDAFCVKEISEASIRGETRRVFDIPINQTHMRDVIRYQCCIALGCVGDVELGRGMRTDPARPVVFQAFDLVGHRLQRR